MTNTYLKAPLPKTAADLLAQRKGNVQKTMNDMVEAFYVKLWDTSPKFVEYLDAVLDGETVEGSLSCDDHEAARMLRDLARTENSPIKDKPLASFKTALKIIMRRYQMGRIERRISLHGEIVQPPIQDGGGHGYSIAAE